MSDQTPAHVAATATIPDALSLSSLTVIGVMKAHDGPAALLRSPRGQIARVTTGQAIFGVTVTAIGDAQVILSDRRGDSHTLVVPRS